MLFPNSKELNMKRKELAEEIYSKISPLLQGMDYSQIYITLDLVREKIGRQIRFILTQTPEATHQS